MTFLLTDSATIDQNEAAATSALQKQALAHQRALRELLPPPLEQQIRAKLCEQYAFASSGSRICPLPS